MVIFGLTGSIAMGKSTAAAMLRRLGVPVHDSDAAVHELLAKDGAAVPLVARAFPDVVRDGVVDRTALGTIVFSDPVALKTLENLLHPLVSERALQFLSRASRARYALVVLDIPLLFETGAQSRCDATIVVSAPPLIQRQRALARPGMTVAKLAGILARQMPDAEKRHRADFVVPTGLGLGVTLRRLRAVVRHGQGMQGRHWPPNPRDWRPVDRPDREHGKPKPHA